MLSKLKKYIKEKWALIKPILVSLAISLKDILIDYLKRMWASVISHTKSFLNKAWNKIKETLYLIKIRVLVKELIWLGNIADWFQNKADKLLIKLYGGMDELEEELTQEDEPIEDISAEDIPAEDISTEDNDIE